MSWATLKVGQYTFRLRDADSTSELRITVEPVDAEGEEFPQELLDGLSWEANRQHPELKFRYIPDYVLIMADLMAKNLEGEVLATSEPPRILQAEGVAY